MISPFKELDFERLRRFVLIGSRPERFRIANLGFLVRWVGSFVGHFWDFPRDEAAGRGGENPNTGFVFSSRLGLFPISLFFFKGGELYFPF